MMNETHLPCNGEAAHDMPKYIAIFLSVLLSLTALLSTYGIIWFERFGTDSKRILINQLFSSMCWYFIVSILCLQFPITVRIIFKGAFNQYFCALVDFGAVVFYNLVLGKLNIL